LTTWTDNIPTAQANASVFFIFCPRSFFENNFKATAQAAHWVLLPRKSQPKAKPKEPLFCQRSILFSTFRQHF
jgi:hypothetical protein